MLLLSMWANLARWVNPPKGRHRHTDQVTVRSAAMYVLLGALLGGMTVIAGFGYYVMLGGGVR
jgi:hypothetical protein